MFCYNQLWKQLIDRKENKSTFAINCHLTKNTLAKLTKDQYVDMKTLDKICTYLQCPIEEIVTHK